MIIINNGEVKTFKKDNTKITVSRDKKMFNISMQKNGKNYSKRVRSKTFPNNFNSEEELINFITENIFKVDTNHQKSVNNKAKDTKIVSEIVSMIKEYLHQKGMMVDEITFFSYSNSVLEVEGKVKEMHFTVSFETK